MMIRGSQILKLDEDMKSKKFRVQRDAVKAMNISMTLFIQLLTKTCEVVLATSGSSISGKRGENTLELDHLIKAVKRYDVLAFMKDIVAEFESQRPEPIVKALSSVNPNTGTRAKRNADTAMVIDLDDEKDSSIEGAKKLKTSQTSITSFFSKPPAPTQSS